MKRARTVSSTRRALRGPAAAGASVVLRPESDDLAVRKLAETLHRRTSEYRTDATVDLTMIDALLEHEGPAAARTALDGHAAALESLLENLHAAVAQAAAEREVQELLDAPSPRIPTLRQRFRASVSSMAGAAALLLALVASGPRVTDPKAVVVTGDRVASATEDGVLRPRPASVKRTATTAVAGVRSVRERLLRVAEPRARGQERAGSGSSSGEAFVQRVTSQVVRNATAPAAATARPSGSGRDPGSSPTADGPSSTFAPEVEGPKVDESSGTDLESAPVEQDLAVEVPPIEG